jgi:hypothetical protein
VYVYVFPYKEPLKLSGISTYIDSLVVSDEKVGENFIGLRIL